MTRYAPLAVFVLLALLLALPLLKGKDPSGMRSALIGSKAPGLARQAGPVLVNFFASWCLPCAAEQGVLEEIARTEKIILRGVNYKDKEEAMRGWLEKYGNPYRAITADPDGRIAVEWGVTGVPETFLVDKAGIVRYRHAGPLTPEIYKAEIRPLLAEMRK